MNNSQREELREKFNDDVRQCFDNFGHDVVNFGKEEGSRHSLSRKYMKYIDQETEKRINAQIKAVLDRLEEKKLLMVFEKDGAKWGIRTSAIQQERARLTQAGDGEK